MHSKSRREKKIANYCLHHNIDHYLPLETRIKQYSNKRVKRQIPLFPGYLFCACDERDRYNLLMTHDIAQTLAVVDQHSLINDVEKIYLAENGCLNPEPCQYLSKGQQVKITTGLLKGYQGIIQTIKGHQRLVLNVDFIHCAASIEIDQHTIEIV